MAQDNRFEKIPNKQNKGSGDGIAIFVALLMVAAIVSSSPTQQNTPDKNDTTKHTNNIDTIPRQNIEHGAYVIDSFAQQLFGVKQR